MYLAARIANTNDRLPADLGTVKLPELLLALIAWMVVAGTVLVPGLRARTRKGIPRAVGSRRRAHDGARRRRGGSAPRRTRRSPTS
jgi:hypothetical protein